MPNELSISLSMSFAKSSLLADSTVSPFRVSVSGTRYIKTVQSVGITAEPVLLGDIATIGYFYLRNLDAVNFVTLQAGFTGTPLVKLAHGEAAVLRLDPASVPHLKADTAAVNVEILLIEN